MFENKYKILGEITILYLNKKDSEPIECFIDTEILQKIKDSGFTWFTKWNWKSSKNYYVVASQYVGQYEDGTSKSKPIYLSRFIMDAPPETHVDHIDHNTMNNRMENLRVSTIKNNTKNRKGSNKNNTSGHRNVCWINGYWRIQLQINDKMHK